MHKKPIVAVLLFGLLLITSLGVAEARVDPGNTLEMQGQVLPNIARGIVKDAVTGQIPINGPTTTVSAGTFRTGATFCDGDYNGGGYFLPSSAYFYGDEAYATYQDPEELGTCAGQSGVYTFDVTALYWVMFNNIDQGPYHIQPLVLENAGDFICPVPGAVVCGNTVYEVSMPAGSEGYLIAVDLPIDAECCQFGPYFIGMYFSEFLGAGQGVEIVEDGNPIVPCYNYNDYGGGFVDMSLLGISGNMYLSSSGNAYDQNLCPGLPGVCDFQSWHGDQYYYWQAPDGNLANDYFTRYTADVSCTLQSFRFRASATGIEGTTPTYRVSVWGANGPTFAGRQYPMAFGTPHDQLDPNHLLTIDIPIGSIVTTPAWNDVDLSSYNFEFGPGEVFFVSVGLSDNTPLPGTDIVGLLSDDGSTPTGRSGFYAGVISDWVYMDEVFGGDYDMMFEAYVCCEVVEAEEVACDTPGPDDWSTWAHDYQRTSATSIEVGDPCQINPVWIADQPQNCNFTQATAANDRVYISADQAANVYDLNTGALVNTVTGLPHIFTGNRGNITVEGGDVYVVGGTGQSIGQWDTDLSVNTWVNGIGGTGGPLGANIRFGAATAIPALGIVIIGTEDYAGGELYALNTADGTLFGGWATNPVTLNSGIWHGSAFDGTDLFVGTADGGASNGQIYSIDAATGTINWGLAYNGDGFPAGVSIDGDYLYASSSGLGTDGFRYKLNKADGSIVWSFGQQRSLYGAPAIGRSFVYINLDGLGLGGIYAIDKATGAPVHNFATDGVGQVTQHVTITCDNYMFAGDRNANWWLLDLVNFVPVWNIEMPWGSPVMGTAVTSNLAADKNYAILTAQFGGPTAGLIAAYEFNSGDRPLINQNTFTTTIGVEFGTGPGVPYTEPDVFTNNGCADANFVGIAISDPLPDPIASQFTAKQSQYAAAVANRMVDANYNTYINDAKQSKAQDRLFDVYDVENSQFDQYRLEARQARTDAKNARGARLAASANALVRTSAVAVTTPLPAGSSTDVDWLFDGSNLERGVDVEVIDFDTDDPDRIALFNQPSLEITYAGGCFSASDVIAWNTGGSASSERLYNDGRLGEQNDGDDLDWMGEGADVNFSAAFFLAGIVDEAAIPPVAQFFTGDINHNPSFTIPSREFLPDPWPGPDCDFRSDTDVLMGYKRENGCPGTPTEIRGEWLRTAYVDTNIARLGTVGEAIGTRVEVTEVGAYDPLYGDFKLQRFIVINRDAVDKGPIYAGSWFDWDVPPSSGANTGFFSLAYNGYGIYDGDNPASAYGIFDPNLPTAYGGVDPTFNRPQRINPMGERADDAGSTNSGNYSGPWQSPDADPWEELHEYALNRLPQFEDGPINLDDADPHEDFAGLITLKGQILPANDTIAFHQTIYAIDASSGDENTMEADGLALAQRAAKWAGFARGDVNDDNTVNLLDVCWLLSGHQIYPDTYNGDVDLSGAVDAADEAYLLDYVTGLGAAPLGDWRFTF